MTQHFADRLIEACRDKGAPVCVGLDPVYERLPESLRSEASSRELHAACNVILTFCSAVLETVAPHVPCVKIQSACFERYLWPGVEVYHRLIQEARSLGLIVIADAKRGDIGTSSAHYAAGCLGDHEYEDWNHLPGPDALTVNSYLGIDGLEPFIDVAVQQGKGLFALVRTSNPGSDAVQQLALADGRTVADAVGQLIADAGRAHVGQSGYSLLGAVVGATKRDDTARLRDLMPQQIFLVPGFGAQGATADDVRACFRNDGSGALITASRSIIYAFKDKGGDWQKHVENAAIKMKNQVAAVLP